MRNIIHRTPYVTVATIVALTITLITLPKVNADPQSLKTKAQLAKRLLREWYINGRDTSQVLKMLKEVKRLGQERKLKEAELLLDQAINILETPPPVKTDPFWQEPREVPILGYTGDVMEPFITRDGKYLLFNDAAKGNTNLYLAKSLGRFKFQFLRPLTEVNTSYLEGVPSVSTNGIFCFISTRSYFTTHRTLYLGTFHDGTIPKYTLTQGNISRNKVPWLTMDAEITCDGKKIYFVEAHMQKGGVPDQSNIGIAELHGTTANRLEKSSYFLKSINTAALEYAPSISCDELELFFTRAIPDPQTHKIKFPQIFWSKRSSIHEPFPPPRRITCINGFVEAPTISPDGLTLYYHKHQPEGFRLFAVSRKN